MSDIKHGLVEYTSRDYDALMEEFWRIVPAMTELWKLSCVVKLGTLSSNKTLATEQ